MDKEQIQQHMEKLMEGLEKATPGPWSIIDGKVYGSSTTAIEPLIHEFNEESNRDIKNAHLIANSPTWHETSLTIMEQQQRENDRLRTALLRIKSDVPHSDTPAKDSVKIARSILSDLGVSLLSCLICGDKYKSGSMHYDDTCDSCARKNGIL